MNRLICSTLFATAAVAGNVPISAQTPSRVPSIQASQTQPTAQGGANRAVVLRSTDDGLTSVVGTAELGGLELYDLSGHRTGSVPAGEAVGLDLRYLSLTLGGSAATILAVADATNNSLRFYTPQAGSIAEVTAREIPLGFAVENLCLYHSAQDGMLYTYAVGDGGEVDQYMIFGTPEGRVDARQVRRLHVPSTTEHCVADDANGQLYVSEQAVGIWRFDAEPESDVTPTLIDAVRLGHITEEVGGVALYDGGDGARWLVASDASAGQLHVYDRAKDDAFIGSFKVAGAQGAAVEEPGGLYATSLSLPGHPSGALLLADEDAAGGSNYKIVPFDRLAGALRINAGTPQPAVTAVEPAFPIVRPIVETEPVVGAGDAADDPAIWANLDKPAESLIIGTDKQGGLNVYDLTGRSIQFLPDGKMNNVDLRDGFPLGGERVVLVTASDRSNKAVAIYRLDTVSRRLVNVADGIQATGLSDPYGLCMYRSPRSGKYYVFVGDPDGTTKQWELVPTRQGKVRIKPVRTFKFASQAEGCATDEATGALYFAEEDVGLWRLGAEPRAGSAMRSIDKVESNPKIKDDLEGVGIYDLGGGRGYVVVSSQGNDSYAVYRREGDQAYLGSFRIVADGPAGIDGVSETDGLEVTSANLGPGLEHGALVAQDGRNVLPVERQNFKIVAWKDIASALNLEVRR
jgi:3-phytase